METYDHHLHSFAHIMINTGSYGHGSRSGIPIIRWWTLNIIKHIIKSVVLPGTSILSHMLTHMWSTSCLYVKIIWYLPSSPLDVRCHISPWTHVSLGQLFSSRPLGWLECSYDLIGCQFTSCLLLVIQLREVLMLLDSLFDVCDSPTYWGWVSENQKTV